MEDEVDCVADTGVNAFRAQSYGESNIAESVNNPTMDLEDIELLDDDAVKKEIKIPPLTMKRSRRRTRISRTRKSSYVTSSNPEQIQNVPSIIVTDSDLDKTMPSVTSPNTELPHTEPSMPVADTEPAKTALPITDDLDTEIPMAMPTVSNSHPARREPAPSVTNTDLPMFHEKPDPLRTAQNVLLQPEMHFLRQELDTKKDEERRPRSRLNSSSSVFSEEELALVRRFPWLAERLKLAWAEVKDQTQNEEAKTTKPKPKSRTGSILKQREKTEKPTLSTESKDEERAKPKVVFSRNVPLFVYSNKTRKAIKVGGDTSDNMTEEVYKALEYNPELKKITMDLQDICKPNRDKTIRLEVSYISSTTNFNPLVISEHMARYSGKKEDAIKYLVREIERRLSAQRDVRVERDEQWRKQFEEIFKARMEAEERENDIMLARRQLDESRKQNKEIMTEFERQGERRRRIQLRTKSIPLADRIKPPQKRSRRQGVAHISLHHHNLLSPPGSK